MMNLKELEKAINTFLKALPEREGNLFIRRYFFVETTADIGKRYGISAGNVAVILTRTRQKLRVYLQKEGYDA